MFAIRLTDNFYIDKNGMPLFIDGKNFTMEAVLQFSSQKEAEEYLRKNEEENIPTENCEIIRISQQ
jgi:hypothetical protein